MGRGLALTLLLAACSSETAPVAAEPLPRAVAVAMVAAGGQPLTAYFGVEPNPRGHVDVRVARGLQLPGPKGIFRLAPDDNSRRAWTLTEELGNARVPMQLPGDVALRPVRFEEASAWLFPAEDRGYRCDLRTGACVEAQELPSLPLTHTGPGEGFRLSLQDRTLRFRQPHQPDTHEGEIVASRVLDIIGVRWLHELPDPEVLEYLDRTFRGRSTVWAAEGDVVVDGEMAEWAVAEPAVVDAPWQAAVRDHWHGPSDASFSVAVRSTPARVCFGGRFRDDERLPGDELHFALGPTEVRLDLVSGAVSVNAAEERGDSIPEAHLGPEAFGWHYEVCVPRTGRARDRTELAFAAWITDVDGTDPGDELGTAPVVSGTPTGTLKLSP